MARENPLSLIAAHELRKSSNIQEISHREEVYKKLELLRTWAMDILSLVVTSSPDFSHMFLVQSVSNMNAFVFSYYSDRILVVDLLARCPQDQMANFDSYNFASHQEFEKKITQLTRTAEKPNNQLAKCRAWDVALNMVVKIEALDSEAACIPIKRLLCREYHIMKHLWDFYMRENMELDEMTGVPIVFHYEELPNPVYNYDDATEYKVYDIFGNLVNWKSKNRSTLSYMCMEQMGPNLQYITEVMQKGKRKGSIFDMDTAFKAFDQLLCRCLQIHRFNVVHNAIEPNNIYFGRSIAFNVLYVLNFNVATVFDHRDPYGNRGRSTDNELHGSPRFASHKQLAGAQPHPVHDLESAFYTLIAMLTNNLPWDTLLPTDNGLGSLEGTPTTGTSWVADSNLSNRGTMNQTDLAKIIERNAIQKLRESKINFWKSPGSIARVLADIKYLANGDDKHRVPLATEIVQDLYSKIRDLLLTVGSESVAPSFFSNLLQQHSNEYQTYTDLRRSVLLFFRFEFLSAFINTPTYQKRVEALSHDDQDGNIRVAWNLTHWCFHAVCVELAVSPNSRCSVVRLPVSKVARVSS